MLNYNTAVRTHICRTPSPSNLPQNGCYTARKLFWIFSEWSRNEELMWIPTILWKLGQVINTTIKINTASCQHLLWLTFIWYLKYVCACPRPTININTVIFPFSNGSFWERSNFDRNAYIGVLIRTCSRRGGGAKKHGRDMRAKSVLVIVRIE